MKKPLKIIILVAIILFSGFYIYTKIDLSKIGDYDNSFKQAEEIKNVSFDFSEIKKKMSNSNISVPILLPDKIEFETPEQNQQLKATYEVTSDGGYRVSLSIGDNCNNAEYCSTAYFGAEKYNNSLGFDDGIAWEVIKITEEIDGYYFNESPRAMPTFEFIYKDNLYFLQIKNKSKEELVSLVKEILSIAELKPENKSLPISPGLNGQSKTLFIKENLPIEIKNENNKLIKISGSVNQEINFDKDMLFYEGLDHDGMSSIEMEDHNKDGYNDLLIMRDTSGLLVTSYSVYLYDKSVNKFIFGYFLTRADSEYEDIEYSKQNISDYVIYIKNGEVVETSVERPILIFKNAVTEKELVSIALLKGEFSTEYLNNFENLKKIKEENKEIGYTDHGGRSLFNEDTSEYSLIPYDVLEKGVYTVAIYNYHNIYDNGYQGDSPMIFVASMKIIVK